MTDVLLEPFQYQFVVNGMYAAVLAGALCGLLGVFITLRGMSYIGHGLSHAVFGGAVVAYAMGISFYLGAGLWGFLCAVGVYLLIAGILALIGIRKLKVSSPDKTLTQGRRSVDAVKRAVSAGMQDVKLIASRGAKQFTTNTKGELLTVYRGQAAPKEAVPQTFPPASDTHVASTGDASTTAGSSTTGGATVASGR